MRRHWHVGGTRGSAGTRSRRVACSASGRARLRRSSVPSSGSRSRSVGCLWPVTSPERRTAPARQPEWSVARAWDEATLDAIRRDVPQPASPRPQPLPRLGRHVGRLGRLRARGTRLLPRREARRCRRGCRQRRGDQLRRLPRARVPLPGRRRRVGLDPGLRRPDGRRCATRPTWSPPRGTARPHSATGSPPRCSQAGADDGSNEAGRYTNPDYRPGQPAARRGQARRRR